MDQYKLEQLIQRSEGPKLDFKMMIDLSLDGSKKELAKDVIALANSRGGRGYLIIGVEDKTKRLVGIDQDEITEERIQQVVANRAYPPVEIRYECFELNNKVIGVITVFKSSNAPHQMRQTGAFYLRRGSTTDIATRDEIARLMQASGLVNIEIMPLKEIDIEVLNMNKVSKFLEKHGAVSGELNYTLLRNLGIIRYDRESEAYNPTVGALLLFCDNPQLYMPHSGIKVINRSEINMGIKHFNGPILTVLDNVVGYFDSLMNHANYPLDVLEEVLGNALVHRDYFDNSRKIVVYISNNKVEVINPGALLGYERINSLMKEVNPARRNNWLYEKVIMLDEKNRFIDGGTGLQRIRKGFKKGGKVRFINLRKLNLFKVILPGINEGNK